jgi:hypothetical protein
VTEAASCIGVNIACDTLAKGLGVTVVGFVLFVGCVQLLLSAVLGRAMGYLVLGTAFFGWMFVLSALWTFGFYSQGIETPVDLGPRGAEPTWIVETAGVTPSDTYDAFASYPDPATWKALGSGDAGDAARQSVTSAVQAFLAEHENEAAGLEEFSAEAFQGTDFAVQDVRFATEEDTSLAVARAYLVDGGPLITVYLHHDSGSVNRFSWLFMIVSFLAMVAHVPFLDRAEKKRKDILTGGGAPPWLGPA